MTGDSYRLFYSAWTSPPWTYWLPGLLGIPLFWGGRVWWRRARAASPQALLASLGPPALLMVLGTAVLVMMVVLPAFENAVLAIRVARGRYTHVEGRVTHFVRGDPSHHVDESWWVVANDHTYSYSYSPSSGSGYVGPTSPGAPLDEGSLVRIADVDGRIARLEIAK
jgi:hypothetical protein